MRKARARIWVLAAVVTALVIAPGCGSSAKATGSSNGKPTYTVGLLTDETGLGSSSFKTSVQGVAAGVFVAHEQGYNLKYVVGDTMTSPTEALAAAQKLVEQDHVLAVIAMSGLTFAAARYLTAQGIPVVGSPTDGPEWPGSTNMFPVFGYVDSTKVATTIGAFMKKEGVTTVGTLGYGITPLSAEAAKSYGASAQIAGLKVGYVNSNFPFGGTNVQPVALAMKNAGVNGIATGLEPNTGLALVTALHQLGVNLRSALLATGYGGDLLQGGPGAIQAGQGVFFYLSFQPVEMHTPATVRFENGLRSAGVNGDPTFAEYQGYASVNAIVRGLHAAGPNPSHASLIQGLTTVHNFDAAGLLDGHTVEFGNRNHIVYGPDNCLYMTKLVGSTFQLVQGADPICGTTVPDRTVSPST